MTKVLPATCQAQVVTADGLPLTGATILSQGVGSSEGIAVLDEDQSFYVADITPDLKTTLEKVIDALTQIKSGIDKIADTLTDIGGGMAGSGTAPPGTLVASVTQIKQFATTMDTAKTALNTLKGALR